VSRGNKRAGWNKYAPVTGVSDFRRMSTTPVGDTPLLRWRGISAHHSAQKLPSTLHALTASRHTCPPRPHESRRSEEAHVDRHVEPVEGDARPSLPPLLTSPPAGE